MSREWRIKGLFQLVLADCRFTERQVRNSPVFTAVAVITLALGIGSSTAMFSAIDGVLLHPYPYKNASQLATIRVFAGDQFRAWRFPARAFVDFKERNHSFEDLFGLVYRGVHFATAGGTEEINGSLVSSGAFESLGIPARFGRALIPADFRAGAAPVFVLSHSLWTKLFGRDPKALGKTYILDGVPTVLVGVMPPRFRIGGCDLWLPLDIKRDMYVPGAGIQSNEIWTVGHLKAGTSPENAAADLQVIASPFQADDPIYFPRNFRIVVLTLRSDAVGGDFKLGLFALLGAVGILLLIACSNVANLLLARATTREKEFGIRVALGASRGRIVSQLAIESVLLALTSCALGSFFAFAGLKVMLGIIPPETIPLEAAVRLSPTALLSSIILTGLVAVACGLAPVLHALRTDVQNALSSTGKAQGVDSRQGALRSALVMVQIALAVVLATCSGLVLQSLFALQRVNIGFNPSRVVYARLSWPEGRYAVKEQKNAIFRAALDHITPLPGVLAAAGTSDYPPFTWGWTTVAVLGQTLPQNRNTASVLCSEGYFQTLDRRLRLGRLFTKSDIDSASRVVVVNETFARNHFGDASPVGHVVRFRDYETLKDWPQHPYFEIIGVVAEARNTGLQEAPRPEVYLPATLTSAFNVNLLVQTSAHLPAIRREIRAIFFQLDPDIAVGETGTIANLLEKDYFARPRFLLSATGTFAVMALLLVAGGIFSVISYNVALQTREIGIRMALGARRIQVVSWILTKGARLILSGIAIGLFGSYFLTRLIANAVWGVSATDPTTFASVAIICLLVGLLACLLPAQRASRVDPMVALRHE